MTQTIKIEVPEGKEAIYDETTQTVKFVNTEPVRSKSIVYYLFLKELLQKNF